MKLFPLSCVIASLLYVAGCESQPKLAPSIGEAYAGPASLNIRQDIAPRSAVVATVPHGERLEILQTRRRFIKVRTARMIEGWTDERLLLSAQQVAGLRALSERSKSAPSQGAATTYDTLNVHTEPNRQSPSFLQIKEGDKVDVIGRKVAPRVSPRPPSLIPVQAVKTQPKKKTAKQKAVKGIAPPPPPAAPKPPADWVQLSRPVVAPPAPPVAQEAKPVLMDDWTLVRNAAGQSGWVLTSRLVMAIPDEVAQYAEGRRITSYFSLGEVRDKGAVKPSWLWTTVERSLEPHDFDSIRVFVWSLRRHRYETAYIERNLKGFAPVLAGQGGFTIDIEKKDGLRYRRRYVFTDNRVRFAGDERVDTPPAQAAPDPAPTLLASEKPPPSEDSFYSGLKQRIRRLFGR